MNRSNSSRNFWKYVHLWKLMRSCVSSNSFNVNFRLQVNPQHTIPFLDDNGVRIADSHAICTYLCDKYGTNDELYPKDLIKRALVNSRLYFDAGHIFCRLHFLYEPVCYRGSTEFPQEKIEYVRSQWGIMERFLENSKYLCGDKMTIADLCCVATVTSIDEFATIDAAKYPKFTQWIKRLSQLPYYEEKNGAGARAIQETVRQTRQKNILAAQSQRTWVFYMWETRKNRHIIICKTEVMMAFACCWYLNFIPKQIKIISEAKVSFLFIGDFLRTKGFFCNSYSASSSTIYSIFFNSAQNYFFLGAGSILRR